MLFHSFSPPLFFFPFFSQCGERITKRRSKGKEREREMTEEDEARQPVTNLTLNQPTCARLHKRTPVHTSVHALFSLSISLNVGYSLSCNMCNIMYMRCFPLGYSRRRRSEYVDPLNKLARVASAEEIRLSHQERKRNVEKGRGREASRGMRRPRNSFARLLDAVANKVMRGLKFQNAIFHSRATLRRLSWTLKPRSLCPISPVVSRIFVSDEIAA